MPSQATKPVTIAYVHDNGWGVNPYLVAFADGRSLNVWLNGSHSAWLDSDHLDLWTTGRRLAWREVPASVMAEVRRRLADDLA